MALRDDPAMGAGYPLRTVFQTFDVTVWAKVMCLPGKQINRGLRPKA